MFLRAKNEVKEMVICCNPLLNCGLWTDLLRRDQQLMMALFFSFSGIHFCRSKHLLVSLLSSNRTDYQPVGWESVWEKSEKWTSVYACKYIDRATHYMHQENVLCTLIWQNKGQSAHVYMNDKSTL